MMRKFWVVIVIATIACSIETNPVLTKEELCKMNGIDENNHRIKLPWRFIIQPQKENLYIIANLDAGICF